MEKRSPKVKEASVSQDNPDRAERLAKALRDNLKRRKAQSREADSADSAVSGAGDRSPAPK